VTKGSHKGYEDNQVYLDVAGEASSGWGKLEKHHCWPMHQKEQEDCQKTLPIHVGQYSVSAAVSWSTAILRKTVPKKCKINAKLPKVIEECFY